jgi:2-polyprenyl-3-methyl-5-hydroxy-6-metoxy-1,4-benzoquinol methylase
MRGLRVRDERPELMDSTRLAPGELDAALRFLEMTNRWFGGTSVILKHLARWLSRHVGTRPPRILDVGTGAADIPLAVVRWAARRGMRVEIVGLDVVEATSRLARARTRGADQVSIVTGDLFAFSSHGAVFDYVVANLFLHHVEPARTVAALAACDRLARRGLVVSDLRRSWASLAAVSALSFAAGNRIVRHDGPLSVRRSFTVRELASLAERAGLGYLRASREPWFRASLAGEKP